METDERTQTFHNAMAYEQQLNHDTQVLGRAKLIYFTRFLETHDIQISEYLKVKELKIAEQQRQQNERNDRLGRMWINS